MMQVWRSHNGEPTKGGYHAMLLRLDRLKQIDTWTKESANELVDFCRDFRIQCDQIDCEAVDPLKCIALFNSVNKY
jgi:hypothetical protein